MNFSSNNAKESECDHWKAAGDFFSSVFNNKQKDMSKETPMESSSSGQSIDECNRSSKKGNFQKDVACIEIYKPESDHWKAAGEALSPLFNSNQNDVTKKNLMEPSSSIPSIDKCDRSTKISKTECDNWKKAVEMFFSFFDNNQNDVSEKNLMELSSSSPSIDNCNRSPKEGGSRKDGACTKLSKSECDNWKTAVESSSSFFNNGKNEMTEKNLMESSSSRPNLDQFYQSLKDLQKDGELSKPKCDHWKKTVEALSSFFNNNENDMTKKNSMKSSPSVDECKRSLKEGGLQKDSSCTHIDSNKKQNLLVSPRHDYGDLKKKSTAPLEKFYVSDEYINETACEGAKMKDEWSQDEEDLLWSQIEALRKKNVVTYETCESHVRACRKSGTSVCFGSFVQETVTTELLDYSSSSYASLIHSFEKNTSFSNSAA